MNTLRQFCLGIFHSAVALGILSLAGAGCNRPEEPDIVRVEKPAAIPADSTPAVSEEVIEEPQEPEKEYVPQPLPVAQETPAEPEPEAPEPAIPDAAPAEDPQIAAKPLPDEPVFTPNVAMTEAHAATTKVRVGDQFPEMTLVDLEGSHQQLTDSQGAKLTVVIFWSADYLFAREQFSRLKRQLIVPFAGHGVRVVAVNVGDEPDRVRELRDEYDVTAVTLLDPQGEAFTEVATEHLPRTYLLDAQGKVLWLDLEYSQMTQRNLRNAILYFLTKGQGEA